MGFVGLGLSFVKTALPDMKECIVALSTRSRYPTILAVRRGGPGASRVNECCLFKSRHCFNCSA